MSVKVWESKGTLGLPEARSSSRRKSSERARLVPESGQTHFRQESSSSSCRSGGGSASGGRRDETKLKRPAHAQAAAQQIIPPSSSPTQLLQTLQVMGIETRHAKEEELAPAETKKRLMQLTASCKQPGALPPSARQQAIAAFAAVRSHIIINDNRQKQGLMMLMLLLSQ